MMRIGSLFSGIEGLGLGLEAAGVGEVVWQVERDPFCLEVLERHWPEATRITDVHAANRSNLLPVDVIAGGFPCQDVSQAGRRAGIDGERSGLWREFARIVDEMRPRVVVVENVYSGAARWLPAVRRDLHVLGYGSSAFVVSASDVGGPQSRARVFVVAHAPCERRSRRSRRDVAAAEEDRQAAARCRARAGREDRRKHWATEPDVRRMAHGVSGRVARLHALGNAVVPQCAEAVGRFIVDTFEPWRSAAAATEAGAVG